MGNLICCTIEPRNKTATSPVPAGQTPAVNGNNGNHIDSGQKNGTVIVEEGAGGLMGEVKLSEAELAELKDIFRMFDKDNSGSIDVNELESMVSSLGISATKEDLNDMIAEADIDKSGTIEFDEFKTLIGPHFQKEKPPEDYIDAFNFFDKDGDGFISRSELRNIMNTVDSKLAESDIEDMIKEADINGDGKIDFDEFIKMMHQQ